MHSFTTERLLIRPLITEDEDFFCQQYTNEKVMRHTGGAIRKEEASKAFQRALRANKQSKIGGKKSLLSWAIVCLNNETIIGTQTLSFLIRPYNAKVMNQAKVDGIKQAEIGIILSPKANGKLFPEEAMGALIEYGFTYIELDKINAFYSNINLATKRFVNKLGFVYNSALQDSNSQDSYQYVDKSLWQKKFIYQIC